MVQSLQQFRLDGKVAMVTGALRGIGAATSNLLAQAGAHVVVTGTRDDAGQEMAANLRGQGCKASFVHLDVTEESQWQDGISQAVSQAGGLDVLVHNAGTLLPGMVATTTIEEIRQVMAVNVEGVVLGTKHAFQAMGPGGSAGKGGSIVVVGSVAGQVGAPFQAAYSASKGAVASFVRSAAVEAAQFKMNIRVNSVVPGTVRTDMAAGAMDVVMKASGGLFPTVEAVQEYIVSAHPMGRLGEPMDIANAVLYLASDASAWVTGAQLPVDGGLTAK